ncbi:MAG TPA: hypothetical protein VN045_16435 [Microbacteriaceae bacterium]|jgi:hypothetical protein|nr:hypothetical protein [Microbacteriaceae bacterium]
MTSASARMAGVTVALYLAYQVVAGLLTALTQLSTLLSQHPGGADLTIWWVGFVPRSMPYVIAGFALFWLWPAKGHGILGLIARAALAAAGGAVIGTIIGAISATTVSGGWFTSMPREYSFPGWYLGQLPSMLLSGIELNFPVLALAAIVALVLFRRVLPNGHSDALQVAKRE